MDEINRIIIEIINSFKNVHIVYQLSQQKMESVSRAWLPFLSC